MELLNLLLFISGGKFGCGGKLVFCLCLEREVSQCGCGRGFFSLWVFFLLGGFEVLGVFWGLFGWMCMFGIKGLVVEEVFGLVVLLLFIWQLFEFIQLVSVLIVLFRWFRFFFRFGMVLGVLRQSSSFWLICRCLLMFFCCIWVLKYFMLWGFMVVFVCLFVSL